MSPGDPDTALLSTSYLGPVQYFTKFLVHPVQIIEQYDHYIKQTYRNRCNIMGANGMLPLSIPVLKGQAHKTFVRDIRIDYDKKWQKLHWRRIESAYRHSPFFEFYMDDFSPFYEKRFEFLLDFNTTLLEIVLQSLEIDNTTDFSEEFIHAGTGDHADYREAIHPKRDLSSDPLFVPLSYQQVFTERHGFKANLSIIDLLFNEGPNARLVLEKCIASPPEHLG
jgi:hypothetical protein